MGPFVLEPQEWEGYKSASGWIARLGTLQLKIRNLSKTCRKSKASEAGIQVYVNIGFTLEGAYGTPGESRHVSESLYSRHATLTVKQVLNAP